MVLIPHENFDSEELRRIKCLISLKTRKRNYSKNLNYTAVTMESQVAAVVPHCIKAAFHVM